MSTRNYELFKKMIENAMAILKREGVEVVAKRWRRESPYQKARYKSMYVFPEVWVYRPGWGLGAVITGEDIGDNVAETAKKIKDYLY
jgi:hypothetical protein